MTLQEAYQLLKKEHAAVKKELAAYQKASFPLNEKEELEKELRKGERRYASLEKQFQELADLHISDMQAIRKLQASLESEQILAISLKEQNSSLLLELEKIRAELAEVKGQNQSMAVRMNKDFTNSSFSSSARPFRKKIPNSRRPSGKKPGGQPGHRGHGRKAPETPHTGSVFLPAPASFLDDPDYYRTGKQIHKKLVDISVEVHVTDFYTDEFRRRSDGKRVHAPFPPGITDDINYGPGIRTSALLLNTYCNVPVLKTSEFISALTGNAVRLSADMICRLPQKFSQKSRSDKLAILQQLVNANVIYTDATGANVNGSQKTVFITTDRDCALYQVRHSKGHAGIRDIPLERSRGTAVHDHDKTFYSYAVHHQECLAHVLRYLQGSIENEPNLKWNRKMQALVREMIHFAKQHPRSRYPDHPKVKQFRSRYREILRLGREEYEIHPPTESYREGVNLCNRMREYEAAHLFFLDHPDVHWTNNISERCLRKFKRKQKQAVVFRSLSGVKDYCNVLTIIETARLQKQNPYDAVRTIFEKGTYIPAKVCE